MKSILNEGFDKLFSLLEDVSEEEIAPVEDEEEISLKDLDDTDTEEDYPEYYEVFDEELNKIAQELAEGTVKFGNIFDLAGRAYEKVEGPDTYPAPDMLVDIIEDILKRVDEFKSNVSEDLGGSISGGLIGGAAGAAIGGPVGSIIGGTVGANIGNAVTTSPADMIKSGIDELGEELATVDGKKGYFIVRKYDKANSCYLEAVRTANEQEANEVLDRNPGYEKVFIEAGSPEDDETNEGLAGTILGATVGSSIGHPIAGASVGSMAQDMAKTAVNNLTKKQDEDLDEGLIDTLKAGGLYVAKHWREILAALETLGITIEDIVRAIKQVRGSVTEEVCADCEDNLTEESTSSDAFGKRAWQLNQIISAMNNEDAYYGGWLYIWPDGEDYEGCLDDFSDKENYKDLEDSFIRNYKAYHEDGLFNASDEVEKLAHNWDKRLGLEPIENLK